MKTCPRCGSDYSGYPATSRTDNVTPICSPCGITEAMEDHFSASGCAAQSTWTALS